MHTRMCFRPLFSARSASKIRQRTQSLRSKQRRQNPQRLNATQREDAVNSLAYEADARLRDPVYGCVGLISILQHRLKQVQIDLDNAKRELANYIGPSAMLPVLNHGFIQHPVLPYNMQAEPVLGLTGPRSCFRSEVQHHQQILNDQQQQQLIAVNNEREQPPEVLRNYDQQQRSGDHVYNNGGFDVVSAAGQVTASEFSHMTTTAAAMSPSLSLGGSYDNNIYQIQHHQVHHHHLQPHQLLLHHQQPQRTGSPEIVRPC